jgi:hypothetical protein
MDNERDSADPALEATKSAERAPVQGQQAEVQVDDSHIVALYSNFCRVTGSPEELIVDFGLNPQPMGTPTKPVVVSQRIVLNYYTAKRLLAALAMSLQRHEGVFGNVETDVQKRVTSRR